MAPGPASPACVVGTWRFDRWIHDRRTGDRLTASGELRLVRETDERISWRETGHLHQASGPVPVWRTYAIVRRGDGWMVTFEDGRDFHPWDPGREVVHPCAADTYRGAYDLSGLPERWRIRWDVSGPAKDYTLRSEVWASGTLAG